MSDSFKIRRKRSLRSIQMISFRRRLSERDSGSSGEILHERSNIEPLIKNRDIVGVHGVVPAKWFFVSFR